MPLRATIDTANDPGTPVFLQLDPDTKQPVRLRLRQVTDAKERELRRRYTAGRRADKARMRSMYEVVEDGIALTRERAGYALVDSENFSLVAADEATAKTFTAALGGQVISPGDTVVLDGKWSAEVKEVVWTVFPKLAAWVSDQADKLSKLAAEEEAEEAESFR